VECGPDLIQGGQTNETSSRAYVGRVNFQGRAQKGQMMAELSAARRQPRGGTVPRELELKDGGKSAADEGLPPTQRSGILKRLRAPGEEPWWNSRALRWSFA